MGFEVVGTGEHEGIREHVDADVMGEIMGAGRRGGRMMRIPARPGWRNQLAPGVIQPDEGMVPLPMTPQSGSPAGFFTSTIPVITWSGQLQKPFRAGRLLVSVVRTGPDATRPPLPHACVGTGLPG